ncbi:MAG: hypothetical protein MZW92_26980 [Comamonadaceae bacterium]|nr:hypothetical protein [Comamonadaceae bacterium]
MQFDAEVCSGSTAPSTWPVGRLMTIRVRPSARATSSAACAKIAPNRVRGRVLSCGRQRRRPGHAWGGRPRLRDRTRRRRC